MTFRARAHLRANCVVQCGVDWGNLMDAENRAPRSERYSGYARKTLRQAIWVLRREISSRGAGQGGQRLERGILHVEAPVKKPPISRVQEMGGESSWSAKGFSDAIV